MSARALLLLLLLLLVLRVVLNREPWLVVFPPDLNCKGRVGVPRLTSTSAQPQTHNHKHTVTNTKPQT